MVNENERIFFCTYWETVIVVDLSVTIFLETDIIFSTKWVFLLHIMSKISGI